MFKPKRNSIVDGFNVNRKLSNVRGCYKIFIRKYGYRNVAFLIYVFVLLYPMVVTSFFLALYFAVFMCERMQERLFNIKWRAYAFGSALGLISIMGFFIYKEKYYALKEIEKNITFYILPLLAVLDYKKLKEMKIEILCALFFGLFSLEVFAIGKMLLASPSAQISKYLTLNFGNKYLSEYVNVHHAYFSLALSISLVGTIIFFGQN